MVQRDARLAGILLLPLLAAAVFSWARLLAELNDVPADQDYLDARALLEREGFMARRDALAVLPPWSLRPLAVIADLDPIGADGLAAQPLDRFRRLWLLVEPDAAPFRDPLVERLGAPTWRLDVGRLAVERFELPAVEVPFDFTARLEHAAVAVVDANGSASSCAPLSDGGFGCGREGWQRVAREWLLVSENGQRAVSSHPPARGKRLVVTFADVEVGDRLVVRAGFTRDGADRARTPVRLRVRIDGEEVGRVERAPAFAFVADTIPTAAHAGRRAEVRFEVEADDNSGASFAWDAWTARSAPRLQGRGPP